MKSRYTMTNRDKIEIKQTNKPEKTQLTQKKKFIMLKHILQAR